MAVFGNHCVDYLRAKSRIFRAKRFACADSECGILGVLKCNYAQILHKYCSVRCESLQMPRIRMLRSPKCGPPAIGPLPAHALDHGCPIWNRNETAERGPEWEAHSTAKEWRDVEPSQFVQPGCIPRWFHRAALRSCHTIEGQRPGRGRYRAARFRCGDSIVAAA